MERHLAQLVSSERQVESSFKQGNLEQATLPSWLHHLQQMGIKTTLLCTGHLLCPVGQVVSPFLASCKVGLVSSEEEKPTEIKSLVQDWSLDVSFKG